MSPHALYPASAILLRLNLHLSNWDCLLIAVVTSQSVLLSYVRQPRHKALMLTLPIPFTCAMLAVERPIDATHALGLVNLMSFILLVRWLYLRRQVNIIAAIAGCIAVYCAIGAAVAQALPIAIAQSRAVFYPCVAAVLVYCMLVHRLLAETDDEAGRSTAPMYVKVPIIGVVVTGLVLIKQLLAGFVTTFPFVTTVGAYEARRCLTTIAAAFPNLLVAMCAMLITMREVEALRGRPLAIAAGWVVYLIVLTALRRRAGTMPAKV